VQRLQELIDASGGGGAARAAARDLRRAVRARLHLRRACLDHHGETVDLMSGVFENFNREKLSIEIVESATAVDVLWRGMSDTRNPGTALAPFLNKLADQLSGREVTVDFRQFRYMNSAAVAPILQFVKRLDSNGAQVVVLYDRHVDWQRVNFLCMKTIART